MWLVFQIEQKSYLLFFGKLNEFLQTNYERVVIVII